MVETDLNKNEFDKFIELGYTEKDFIFEARRSNSVGSNIENDSDRFLVTVYLQDLELRVGSSKYKSQVKNKYDALKKLYLLINAMRKE